MLNISTLLRNEPRTEETLEIGPETTGKSGPVNPRRLLQGKLGRLHREDDLFGSGDRRVDWIFPLRLVRHGGFISQHSGVLARNTPL